jgi:hypothetical protein
VVAIPNQVFYGDPAAGRHLVRFSFAKRREVLHEAAARLATLAAGSGGSGAPPRSGSPSDGAAVRGEVSR